MTLRLDLASFLYSAKPLVVREVHVSVAAGFERG
jgi:hypothetical protein